MGYEEKQVAARGTGGSGGRVILDSEGTHRG